MKQSDDFRKILMDIMEDQRNRCSSGDHFSAENALQHNLGLEPEEWEQFQRFISETVARALAQRLLSEPFGTGQGPDDVIEMIFGVAVPASMLVGVEVYKENLSKKEAAPANKYTSTVMAEALVRSFITEKKDLSTIWPTDIAETVTKEFDPVEAFMVGVVCGGWHG
jgi:hypothetical protein